jgi:membrane protease YdiL (CAAX protease family)
MRFFAKSLFAILVAALIAGALTYPAWLLVTVFGDARPDRVMRRVGMIVLAIALYVVLRRSGLATRSTLGYALPRRDFIRQLTFGFFAGLVLMSPLVWGLFGLDLRNPTVVLTSAVLAKLFLQGILTGLTVAFVEETFLRGAMFGAIQRESGTFMAVALPSLLYAAVHFLGGSLRIPPADMDFGGGLRIAADLFSRFTTPLEFIDSFAALLALGILLSLIRLRTGAIAGCVGLHAGGVCVITVLRNMSTTNQDASLAWLVGSYDGVIGWMACVWIGVVTLLFWRNTKKRMADRG